MNLPFKLAEYLTGETHSFIQCSNIEKKRQLSQDFYHSPTESCNFQLSVDSLITFLSRCRFQSWNWSLLLELIFFYQTDWLLQCCFIQRKLTNRLICYQLNDSDWFWHLRVWKWKASFNRMATLKIILKNQLIVLSIAVWPRLKAEIKFYYQWEL